MTDRARELLERAYQYIPMSSVTSQEIRTFLADTNPSETINNSEVDRSERKALSDEEILDGYVNVEAIGRYKNFASGVRFAEKHHGILEE